MTRPSVVAVLAWLAVAGCSGSSTPLTSGPDSTPGLGITEVTATAATDTETARTIASAPATEPTETTDEQTSEPISFGPGDVELPDPSVGLEALAAFQETLTMTFSGTRGGVPETWSQTESLVSIRDPFARQFTTERTGVDATKRSHVEIGGVAYDHVGDGACRADLAVPPGDGGARGQPHDLLPGFLGAERVGAETVGAIATTHVSFDERALGSLDPAAVTGDVWTADDGGYVVRYTMVVEGAAAYLGQGVTGTLTLDYAMQPLDTAPLIVAPADCPPGLIDVALPADATQVVTRPGFQSYTTAAAVVDVAAALGADVVAAGWVATMAPLTTADVSLMAYERGGQRLAISIAPAGAATVVTIILTM